METESQSLLGIPPIEDLIHRSVPRCCIQYHQKLVFLYVFILAVIITIVFVSVLIVERKGVVDDDSDDDSSAAAAVTAMSAVLQNFFFSIMNLRQEW